MSSFVTTRWSLIDLVAIGNSPAISDFVKIYQPILRRFLVTTLRQNDHDADDLLQDFLANKLLWGDLAREANQQRGSFRSFLRTALRNFVRDCWRRDHAQKRAADRAIDFDGSFAEEPASPECDTFDNDWARTVISESLTRVRAECERERQPQIWTIFCHRVLLPALTKTDETTYDELTRRCGLESIRETQNALVTAKRKVTRHVRAVVGNYILDADQLDQEVRELQWVLRHSLHTCGPALFDELFSGEVPVPFRDSLQASPESCLSDLFALDVIPSDGEATALENLLAMPMSQLLNDVPQMAWRDRTLRELFHDTAPPLELLQAMKQLGRSYADTGTGDLSNAGATLYFLAIATALARHKQRITTSDDIVLHQGLLLLSRLPWCEEFMSTTINKCLRRLRVNEPV
ncbi:MAG: sigma-70 family RNA polymerase sigma factor [Planctomycetaceae bacterium]|nr:sigma-70 family RNA polymerase sigma factor [Planctomycetaceae bacterium]